MKKKKIDDEKIETDLCGNKSYIKEKNGIKYKVFIMFDGNEVYAPLELWEKVVSTPWVRNR